MFSGTCIEMGAKRGQVIAVPVFQIFRAGANAA